MNIFKNLRNSWMFKSDEETAIYNEKAKVLGITPGLSVKKTIFELFDKALKWKQASEKQTTEKPSLQQTPDNSSLQKRIDKLNDLLIVKDQRIDQLDNLSLRQESQITDLKFRNGKLSDELTKATQSQTQVSANDVILTLSDFELELLKQYREFYKNDTYKTILIDRLFIDFSKNARVEKLQSIPYREFIKLKNYYNADGSRKDSGITE